MSGSDRNQQPSTLIGLGYLAALILCCLVVGVLAYSQGRETERRHQGPHQHAEWAKSSAQHACANRKPSDITDCIYERVKAAEEESRSEQELSAQQRAATSALIAAIEGALTLIVSGAGLWALIETISQGQKGLERATEANALTAASQRPWLSFGIVSTGPAWRLAPGSFCLAYTIMVKNTGNSPAVFVRPHVGRAVVKNGIEIHPSDFIAQSSPVSEIFSSVIAPGETVKFEDTPFIPGLGVNDEGRVFGDEYYPSYWIGVIYRDQMGGGPYATTHHFGLIGEMIKDGVGEASFSPGRQDLKTLMT